MHKNQLLSLYAFVFLCSPTYLLASDAPTAAPTAPALTAPTPLVTLPVQASPTTPRTVALTVAIPQTVTPLPTSISRESFPSQASSARLLTSPAASPTPDLSSSGTYMPGMPR